MILRPTISSSSMTCTSKEAIAQNDKQLFISIRKYHEIKWLQDVEFDFVKPDNHIPYYFDDNDNLENLFRMS
jgi:hypothetical protein